MKVLTKGVNFFACAFENGQAVITNPQNNTSLVYLNQILAHQLQDKIPPDNKFLSPIQELHHFFNN